MLPKGGRGGRLTPSTGVRGRDGVGRARSTTSTCRRDRRPNAGVVWVPSTCGLGQAVGATGGRPERTVRAALSTSRPTGSGRPRPAGRTGGGCRRRMSSAYRRGRPRHPRPQQGQLRDSAEDRRAAAPRRIATLSPTHAAATMPARSPATRAATCGKEQRVFERPGGGCCFGRDGVGNRSLAVSLRGVRRSSGWRARSSRGPMARSLADRLVFQRPGGFCLGGYGSGERSRAGCDEDSHDATMRTAAPRRRA